MGGLGGLNMWGLECFRVLYVSHEHARVCISAINKRGESIGRDLRKVRRDWIWMVK